MPQENERRAEPTSDDSSGIITVKTIQVLLLCFLDKHFKENVKDYTGTDVLKAYGLKCPRANDTTVDLKHVTKLDGAKLSDFFRTHVTSDLKKPEEKRNFLLLLLQSLSVIKATTNANDQLSDDQKKEPTSEAGKAFESWLKGLADYKAVSLSLWAETNPADVNSTRGPSSAMSQSSNSVALSRGTSFLGDPSSEVRSLSFSGFPNLSNHMKSNACGVASTAIVRGRKICRVICG